MINSWTLFIVKTIDDKHVSKHVIKTACQNYEKYKSYDYFKKAYKHAAEPDVAKNVTF